MPTLQIGNVAERTGVSVATIRYYESIGLLARPARSAAGYRRYTDATVDELRCIRKAQALGFSLEEIAEILKVSRTGQAPCAQVLDLARQHLTAVDERIRQLQRFREQLAAEIAKWDGKKQPACDGLCQIIEGAADAAPIEFRRGAPRGGDVPRGAKRTDMIKGTSTRMRELSDSQVRLSPNAVKDGRMDRPNIERTFR